MLAVEAADPVADNEASASMHTDASLRRLASRRIALLDLTSSRAGRKQDARFRISRPPMRSSQHSTLLATADEAVE
jgi:hypothetical protein